MRISHQALRASSVFGFRGLKAALTMLALAGNVAFGQSIQLHPIATHHTGIYDASASEITAYDPDRRRLFVVNAQAQRVDVFDLRNPNALVELDPLDMSPYGTVVNSVAVYEGVVAVAVENAVKTEPGKVVFFSTKGKFQSQVTVGALPDMLTFTPDGRWLLVANEGEPNSDYSIDPEGTISIIDVSDDADEIRQRDVRTVNFRALNNATLDHSIRIFGPNATVAQDLEPEYIAVSSNSKYAWVTLQENNAIAYIDIKRAKVLELSGLGFKDHSVAGNGLDASDRDNKINIATWPVKGMYLPDGIVSYKARGKSFLVTANEGDVREYDAFEEAVRVGSLTLDPDAFPEAATLKDNAKLGRLTVTNTRGDTDNDGDFDELYSFGGRSFSIWTSDGRLVYDSGDALEQITAAAFPANFNASNTNNTFDNRSDDKGPEPEGIAIGKVYGRTYAFVGLERIGGVMVFDISNPSCVTFEQYFNNRDFSQTPGPNSGGDLGVEGLLFVDAKDSPCRKPLLVVANEISGSTNVYEISKGLHKDAIAGDELAERPEQFVLHQNYPNPFNPSTTIRFSLPEAAHVTIKVYSLAGAEVATLVDDLRQAGNHEVMFRAGSLASGTYFYRMQVNGEIMQMRQLMLVK